MLSNSIRLSKADVFIWTEAYNCGPLLDAFLDSYFKHNTQEINVFCKSSDLSTNLKKYDRVIFHNSETIPSFSKTESRILNNYLNGHKGTATLWSYLIKKRPEKYLLHLDADTIFLGEILNNLIDIIVEGNYSIVGTRRPYLMRSYRKVGLDSKLLNLRPDAVNTDYFIFDRQKLAKYNIRILERMVVGKRTSFLPIVDFFDPATFKLANYRNGIYYIDSPQDGAKANSNPLHESFTKRISFAAVGSGMNFWNHPQIDIPTGYKDFALSSYSLYSKYILGAELNYPVLKDPLIIEKLEKLDRASWTLKI
jgi:hypothetical protein